MKAKDFRPEHFEKGRSFNRSDFNAYVQASDKLARTAYTRYLPSVAAGLLLGLLFSKGVGGFGGNILALVCIFAGLIIGGVFNVKAAKAVNVLAQRLGITKEDVASARKHVKNGTFAWTGEWEGQSREEAPAADNIPSVVSREPQTVPAAPEKPVRAVWAGALLTVGWFLLAVLLLAFRMRLSTTFFSFICLASAILGTAVYLLVQSGMKWKLAGAIAAVVSSLLLTASKSGVSRVRAFGPEGRFSLLFSFNDRDYMRMLGNEALAVFLCLAAVMLYSVLHKDKGNKREGLCGAIAGTVYLVIRLLTRFRPLLSRLSLLTRQFLVEQIASCFTSALAIFLVCLVLHALCRMPQTRVKLWGIGTVWAWLALAGAVCTVFFVLYVASGGSLRVAGRGISIIIGVVYTHQMLLGLSALIGYALLLCKRRVGLYFILLGTGLMLGAQLVYALYYLGLGAGFNFRSILFPTLFGALNPLFAWLAVREPETWKTKDYKKIDKAVVIVQTISDAQLLKEVVSTAHFDKVRKAALDRIDDQKILAEVFPRLSRDLKEETVKRISDQNTLTDLILELKTDMPWDTLKYIKDVQLLRKIALGNCYHQSEEATWRISDPQILKEIAKKASEIETRIAAIGGLKNPDDLLDFLSKSGPEIRSKVHDVITKLKMTQEQRNAYIDAVIREKDGQVEIPVQMIKDNAMLETVLEKSMREDLRITALQTLNRRGHIIPVKLLKNIYEEARTYGRNGLQTEALRLLVNRGLIPADQLKNLYKNAGSATSDYRGLSKGKVEDIVEERLEKTCSENIELLMDFIKDPEMGCNLARTCLKLLFKDKLDDMDSIDDVRQRAIEIYLSNIPAFKRSGKDKRYILDVLDAAVPESKRQKYGLEISTSIYKAEDQFGRYDETDIEVTYKGQHYR